MIVVALLNSRRRHRGCLDGWVSHTPRFSDSIMTVVLMLAFSDQMVYVGLSNLATIDQLPGEITKMQDIGLLKWIRYGRYFALTLVVAFAIEAVHRVCSMSRFKAVGVILAYVALNGLVQAIMS